MAEHERERSKTVKALQDALTEEEYECGGPLDALQHAVLGQVVGAVVVPHLRAAEQSMG